MTARERQRRRRAKLKAQKAQTAPTPPTLTDPVNALCEWAKNTLIVPPGHPRAGEPMEVPAFAVDFLRNAMTAHESALCVGRKNSKSAICAILALGYLCGTLRQDGWRGAIASLSKEKANELRSQVEAIAEASGLNLTIRKSPDPGTR